MYGVTALSDHLIHPPPPLGLALKTVWKKKNHWDALDTIGRGQMLNTNFLFSEAPPKGAGESVPRENCRKASENIIDTFWRFLPCAKNVENIFWHFLMFF